MKVKNEGENEEENYRIGINDFCFLHYTAKYAHSRVFLIVIMPQSDPVVGQRCVLSDDKI